MHFLLKSYINNKARIKLTYINITNVFLKNILTLGCIYSINNWKKIFIYYGDEIITNAYFDKR